MPYKRVSPPVSPDHPDLVDALSKELEAARASGPEDAPYIIEEVLPRSDFYNVLSLIHI